MSDQEFLDRLGEVAREIAVRTARMWFGIAADTAPRELSQAEAAEYVGLGVRQIKRLKGFPEGRKVGRQRIYYQHELDTWIDKQNSD